MFFCLDSFFVAWISNAFFRIWKEGFSELSSVGIPVPHWVRRSKSSRLLLSSWKCGDGLSDGGIGLATAYLQFLGCLIQSSCHSLDIELLDWQFALALDVKYGDWLSRFTVSLACLSVLLLSFILQWLGHHEALMCRSGSVSRSRSC